MFVHTYRLLILLLTAGLTCACSIHGSGSGEPATGGGVGSGGISGAGGAGVGGAGVGGIAEPGGAAGEAGALGMGGATGEGGTSAPGGAAGDGGSTNAGGGLGDGGAATTGGESGEGGAPGQGGVPNVGGAPGAGGAPNAGGGPGDGGAPGAGGAPGEDGLGPRICEGGARGPCECSGRPGFTTYTWTVADQERCFTVYTPDRAGPLPVMIQMNCYARNRLQQSGCAPGTPLVEAADTYGFVAVCASATDGNWTFGNDGVSNDDNPTPCADEDSKDIVYLRGLFDTLSALGDAGTLDADRIYTWGFSQNAMFAAYASICFPQHIVGVWQGGSGLFVAGETNPLPQMEGACRRSDFLELGPECAEERPCDECQYFPAYPVASEPARRACVMAYEDDILFATARPMFTRLGDEGHDATLLSFPDVGRGHANPLQAWAWMVSCLDITPPCDAACSGALVACMADGEDEDPGGDGPGARDAVPRPHPCGDGVCDQFEQNNPDVCPRDCEERPADFEWCGDGHCDALERHEGSCPADCGGDGGGGDEAGLEQREARYRACRERVMGCAPGCAATREMLLTVEHPVIEDSRR